MDNTDLQTADITVMCDAENTQFILQNNMPYIVMDRLEAKGIAHNVVIPKGTTYTVGKVHYRQSDNSIQDIEFC